VFADCIPTRKLYWKEGDIGYEIAQSLETIIAVIRYKLAIAGMPCVSERRIAQGAGPHTCVEWVLDNGVTLTYFFDSLFPEDYIGDDNASESSVDADAPSLRALLPFVQTLVMKGFIPKPAQLLLECLPLLKRVFSTEDNYVSLLRGLRGESVETDIEKGIEDDVEADVASDEEPMCALASLTPPPPALEHITFHVYPEFEVSALQEAAASFEDSWDATQYMMHIF
jgi:hypothetical protein